MNKTCYVPAFYIKPKEVNTVGLGFSTNIHFVEVDFLGFLVY